jgi:hypothetical protein
VQDAAGMAEVDASEHLVHVTLRRAIAAPPREANASASSRWRWVFGRGLTFTRSGGIPAGSTESMYFFRSWSR